MSFVTYNHRNNTSDPAQSTLPVSVCNLGYLNRITRGDKKSAGKLIDIFFVEIADSLTKLKAAIEKTDFSAISNISHKIKSAFAILGVIVLEPVIIEMELLSLQSSSIEKISQLCKRINIVFAQAKIEMNMTS